MQIRTKRIKDLQEQIHAGGGKGDFGLGNGESAKKSGSKEEAATGSEKRLWSLPNGDSNKNKYL